MPSPGRRMLVIKKSTIVNNGKSVEPIDPDVLSDLLDIAASAYCIEDVKLSKRATASKHVRDQMMKSEGFKAGRASIRSRM